MDSAAPGQPGQPGDPRGAGVASSSMAWLLERITEQLESGKPELQEQALRALGRLGVGPEAISFLEGLSQWERDPTLRDLARSSADSIKAREMVHAPPSSLAEALASAEPLHRIEALLACLENEQREAAGLILEHLQREQDEWVLLAGLHAIAGIGKPAHLETLRRHLDPAGSPMVVGAAMDTMLALDVESAFTFITPLVMSRDSQIRLNAAELLFEIDEKAALETLAGVAQSTVLDHRLAAIECLQRFTGADVERILLGILERESEPRAIDELVAQLSRSQAEDTRRMLHELVARGPDTSRINRSGQRPRLAVQELMVAAENAVARESMPARLARTIPVQRVLKSTRILRDHIRPRAPHIAALLTCVALLFVAVRSRDSSLDPSRAIQVSLDKVAKAERPNSYLNAEVDWEGSIVRIDGRGATIDVSLDGRTFAVSAGTAREPVKVGDRIRVRGKVVGRSRLGCIYVDGQSISKI